MTNPQLFVKKPTTVAAMKFTDHGAGLDIVDWVNSRTPAGTERAYMANNLIYLGEAMATANPTDWIIMDQFKDFYVLPDRNFWGVYESILNA